MSNELVSLIESAISQDDIEKILNRISKQHETVSNQHLLLILAKQNALKYFKFNLEQYCNLHKLIITKTTTTNEYIGFLQNSNSFHTIIVQKNGFSTLFLETLVPVLIEACEKFNALEETSKIVQRCLFSSRDFDCYLNDIFEKKKCTEKHTFCKNLLKHLSTLNPTGFHLIFNSLCKTYKSHDQIYKFVLILTEIIGFEVRDVFNFAKIKSQDTNLDKALDMFTKILDVLIGLKFNLDCKINDISFSEFLNNLFRSVMSLTGSPNKQCCTLFLKITELNPLIVESVNETIIYFLLSNNKVVENELVVIKIFEVFSKLHRFLNFITKLIPMLKNELEPIEPIYKFRSNVNFTKPEKCTVEQMLTENILNYFTECTLNLASWQVVNLFKKILFHLNNSINNLDSELFVEILSSLTSSLLLSVRMAEHTVAQTTLNKFVGCLEELKTILGRFGQTLLQREHIHSLVKSFLQLAFYWGEIYLTLEYYSDDIQMEKVIDNNFASCNLTYLHAYLSDKEWCLISERINNFGEKHTKQLMMKLTLQKLRALTIFDSITPEILTAIIRHFSTDENSFIDILTGDRFVLHQIVPQLPTVTLLNLAEKLLDDKMKNPQIYDSMLLTQATLSILMAKINNVALKQKRKLDEEMKKTVFSRVLSRLPTDLFLNDVDDLVTIAELIQKENSVNVQENKIEIYLDLVPKLPVVFCPEQNQKLLVLLLMALHRDLSEGKVSLKCETLILSLIKHNKFTLLDCFSVENLLNLLQNYQRFEDYITEIAKNIFKNDSTVVKFEPAINYINSNIKHEKTLRIAVLVLHQILAANKSHLLPETKDVCNRYKTEICTKLMKRILKTDVDESLIEALALVLRIFLTSEQNIDVLMPRLTEYTEFCLKLSEIRNIRGCLLLFGVILNNKKILVQFENDFVLKIWNCFKAVYVDEENLELFSQLVMLVTTFVPNEQFDSIFKDLLHITEKSIKLSNFTDFCKYLKTWTCIINTNLNPMKTDILRQRLEDLLAKILEMLKSLTYNEDLFEQIIQFQLSIIRAHHMILSASLIDFILLIIPILLMKKENFFHTYNSSLSLLEFLLVFRKELILARLPAFLLQYRFLLKELCANSGSTTPLSQQNADCAHKLEKLTAKLVECNKDMARISMFLIADFLAEYEKDTLHTNVKKHLDNCVYSFISLCDQHSVHYLTRVLSNASTELFKVMYDNYKKYYRFTGKV